MHVSLTEKLDEYVRDKVRSGFYNNASEVIREALRLKISNENTNEAKLVALQAAIAPAWEQAERGECTPFDLESIISELDQETASNA